MSPAPTEDERFGDHRLRFQRQADGRWLGMVVEPGAERLGADTKDELRTLLRRHLARRSDAFEGFDAAIARFTRVFPGGFADPVYSGPKERETKARASEALRASLPLDEAEGTPGAAAAVLPVLRRNPCQLIAWQEADRARRMLEGPDGDAFVHASARFCRTLAEADFRAMDAVARRNDCRTWTVLTYLPWLWAPDRHLFVKPGVTTDFASRVGHPFALVQRHGEGYEVYLEARDLGTEILHRTAELGPRDMIDAQGFLWVTTFY